MFDQSYLRSTGQLWKVGLFMVAPICGVLLICVSLVMFAHRTQLAAFLLLAGISVTLVGLVWGCLAIRCPQCQTRLLWKALQGQAHQNWLTWLLSFSVCPYCEEQNNTLPDQS
jgi:ABC-type cobalamin transport system permease subunit